LVTDGEAVGDAEQRALVLAADVLADQLASLFEDPGQRQHH
jgi:hypothetical protein